MSREGPYLIITEGPALFKEAFNDSGFSFLELIVIIVIAGLLGVLALPNITPMMESVRIRAAADNIKNQLITAKTRAISDPYTHCGVYFGVGETPQEVFVFYDISSGNSYEYDDGTDEIYMGKYIIPDRITMSLPSSGAIVNDVVVFRGDGSAKNGGTIKLTNNYGHVRKINVLPSTGRVRVIAE